MAGTGAARIQTELEAAREALRLRIGAISTADPEAAPAGWTMRELMAHVAFWEEAAVAFISYMLRGQAVPMDWRFGSGYEPRGEWPGFPVHNAREAAWAREQPIEAVAARWDAAHARLLATLETVTDGEAEAHATYFTEVVGHLREHLAELG